MFALDANPVIGTGKTSTARRMGKIFYFMGILAAEDVIECSASDTIGQYIGHTGPKTQKLLERALGKVLFIDEAYRLNEGRFAQEAVSELVDAITKERFANKLVIILAGYDEDINQLMRVNPGLTSRFPEAIVFVDLTSEECHELLVKTLLKKPVSIEVVDRNSPGAMEIITRLFPDLSSLPLWGNARDIQTVAVKCSLSTTKGLWAGSRSQG